MGLIQWFKQWTLKVLLFSLVLFLFTSLPLSAGQLYSEDNFRSFKEKQVILDDFIVNDDSSSFSQTAPAIAMDKSGNYVIVWEDYRNDRDWDIYAQRYNSSGLPLGPNFKVNDDTGAIPQSSPSVSMDGSGNFVITWQDYRNGWYLYSVWYNADIYAQNYDSSGTPLSSNFKVNDDSSSFSQTTPAIAMDDSGNFVITWQDGRNVNSDIYAQKYDFFGMPSGSNFRVNDDTGGNTQKTPAIAMDGSGKFVISWQDHRDGNWDIYAQRYNSANIPIGVNFKACKDVGDLVDSSPSIAINNLGSFMITWKNYGSGIDYNLYAQLYDSSGSPIGSNFKVNDDPGTDWQLYPSIASDSAGNFIITWEDTRDGWLWSGEWYNFNIYAQRYNPSGISLGSNFKVNDDTGTVSQYYPAVAANGSFVITWMDPRNTIPDIYAQRYDLSGNQQGSNFKVNDDLRFSSDTNQLYPDIATDGTGNFIIVWEDWRNASYYMGVRMSTDIYAQKYDSYGTPIGVNFKVDSATGAAPAVAMNTSGSFVIAWLDYQCGFSGHSAPPNCVCDDVYAQRYDNSGVPLGSNFRVNEIVGSANSSNTPAVAIDDYGNFVIVWYDYRNGNYDIYAQIYNSNGIPLGSNFKVNDDTGTALQCWPAIAMNGSGNFVITWHDYRNGNSDIYAQRYNSSGVLLGSNFKVNDGDGSAGQCFRAIAMDGLGNFAITWYDYRNDNYDIYAQIYNPNGIPLSSNFKVNDDTGTALQCWPDIAMNGSGNFVITWYDYRNGNSDIYAQRYDSSGNPMGSNYLVPNPQYANFTQAKPAVAANGFNIYFVWQDNRRAKGWDIYAKLVDWNWTNIKDEQVASLPNSYEISQNYPNPFNPITTIPFSLKVQSPTFKGSTHITLKIYNILGQLVKTLLDEGRLPGNHKVIWDGKDDSGKEVASGVYFYQLKTTDYSETKKMILLR